MTTLFATTAIILGILWICELVTRHRQTREKTIRALMADDPSLSRESAAHLYDTVETWG
jgi:hypothetical protein